MGQSFPLNLTIAVRTKTDEGKEVRRENFKRLVACFVCGPFFRVFLVLVGMDGPNFHC